MMKHPSLILVVLILISGCKTGYESSADDASASSSSSSSTSSSTSSSSTSSSSSSGAAESAESVPGVCGASDGQYFAADYPWNQRVDGLQLDDQSAVIIDYLQTMHNSDDRFRIDGPSQQADSLTGLTIIETNADTAYRDIEIKNNLFKSPDCDPARFPLPNGALEGENSYTCSSGGDCRLLVVDKVNCRIHEAIYANLGENLQTGCATVWDLGASYQETLRGEYCRATDLAGLPIVAQLFTADEIAAGKIEHAIRFVLPSSLIRNGVYVRPATHASGTTGPDSAPPFGTRMRLKNEFDAETFSEGAKVVLKALKQYGMILSHTGNVTFSAADDRFTTAKWSGVGLDADDLTSLSWSDFEVVELGERITQSVDPNCVRNPVQTLD